MPVSKSLQFSPDLVYVSQSPSRDILFPSTSDRDAMARTHLALMEMGKAMSFHAGNSLIENALRNILSLPVRLAGKEWLFVTLGEPHLLTDNMERLAQSLDRYEASQIPSDAVWLIVNNQAGQSTGANARSVPQAKALLVAKTPGAKDLGARVFIEALRQRMEQQARNSFAAAGIALAASSEDKNTPSFGYEDDHQYRVTIQYENGESRAFWPQQLHGYREDCADVPRWLAYDWVAPVDAVRWRLTKNPESSQRETSGWVVQARTSKVPDSHQPLYCGEVFNNTDPVVTVLARMARAHRKPLVLGDFTVFPLKGSGYVDGTQIHALRLSTNGVWQPVEIGAKDSVVWRRPHISIVFAQSGSDFYHPRIVETSTLRPAKPSRDTTVTGTDGVPVPKP